MNCLKKKRKRRFVKYALIALLLVPGSALAFFGSENAVLTAILTELKAQSTSLMDLFNGIDYIDTQIANMRYGIDDPLNLQTPGLLDREEKIDELIPSTETLYTFPFVHGLTDYQEILGTIEKVWGKHLDTDYGDIFRFKDFIPTYAMGQTALIADESKGFAQTGENILEDLSETTEGKASVRGAQAQALQVQQLAQIESNQGMQISLQSQQVLSENQLEKGIHEVSGEYLKMLNDNYRTLSEDE